MCFVSSLRRLSGKKHIVGKNWGFPFSSRKKTGVFPSHKLCLILLFYLLAPVPQKANPELGMRNLTEEDHHSAMSLFYEIGKKITRMIQKYSYVSTKSICKTNMSGSPPPQFWHFIVCIVCAAAFLLAQFPRSGLCANRVMYLRQIRSCFLCALSKYTWRNSEAV